MTIFRNKNSSIDLYYLPCVSCQSKSESFYNDLMTVSSGRSYPLVSYSTTLTITDFLLRASVLVVSLVSVVLSQMFAYLISSHFVICFRSLLKCQLLNKALSGYPVCNCDSPALPCISFSHPLYFSPHQYLNDIYCLSLPTECLFNTVTPGYRKVHMVSVQETVIELINSYISLLRLF